MFISKLVELILSPIQKFSDRNLVILLMKMYIRKFGLLILNYMKSKVYYLTITPRVHCTYHQGIIFSFLLSLLQQQVLNTKAY